MDIYTVEYTVYNIYYEYTVVFKNVKMIISTNIDLIAGYGHTLKLFGTEAGGPSKVLDHCVACTFPKGPAGLH